MSAETWLGAAAWASGSHTCRGAMAALIPKPTRVSPTSRAVGGRPAAAPSGTVGMVQPAFVWDRKVNRSSSAPPLTCPAIR